MGHTQKRVASDWLAVTTSATPSRAEGGCVMRRHWAEPHPLAIALYAAALLAVMALVAIELRWIIADMNARPCLSR